MFLYIIKRLLIFIPTLLVISLVAFALSKLAPGDPVELLKQGQAMDGGQMAGKLAGDQAYLEISQRLGLDLPTFYFGISSAAYPDTLYKVVRQSERTTLDALVGQYGNWKFISDYYTNLKKLQNTSYMLPKDSTTYGAQRQLQSAINTMLNNHKDLVIQSQLTEMDKVFQADTLGKLASIAPLYAEVKKDYTDVVSQATPSKQYIPDIKWYGLNNQYHRWISNFLKGNFGTSYLDSRPVSHKIWDALRWTLIINIVSLILSYLISIPIGVTTAVHKNTAYDRIVTTVLFVLYSLPSFWVGTMLIVFFTTSDYSPMLKWFPPGGLTDLPLTAPAGKRALDIAYHLILPIFCVTYGSLAYISRQMRGGMLSVVRQDYIRTAQAKGLPPNIVTWRHAFRNSLFPIITMFAYIFPAAIAGSVVIEVIYSIPGMGGLAYSSIIARDWPVVYTILMFAAILTMVGNLIADMLYALADPRVIFK